MWAIKILKGPQAGQIIKLSQGEQKIGRGESCQVMLQGQGISKEHAALVVTEIDLTIQDLNSRNGTFVNGTRIPASRFPCGICRCPALQLRDQALSRHAISGRV